MIREKKWYQCSLYEYVSNRIKISLDYKFINLWLDPSTKEKVRYVHWKFYRRVENEYTKKRIKLDPKILLDTASDNIIACSTDSQTLGNIVFEEIGYEERPNVKDWKENWFHILFSFDKTILCTKFQHAMTNFEEIIEDF